MTRRRWNRLGFAVLACAVLAPLVARAEPKLEVVSTWASEYQAKAGDGIVVKARLKNTGTTVVHDILFSLHGTDHFNFFGPLCEAGIPEYSYCRIPELAPGEEAFATFAAEVCCFPKGEMRDAVLVVSGYGQEATTSTQVIIRIGGPSN